MFFVIYFIWYLNMVIVIQTRVRRSVFMKKVFSYLLVLVLTVVSFGFVNEEASAAANDYSPFSLTTSQTSATTERVTANSMGRWNVVNTGNYNVSFRVFKNGTAVTGYQTVNPGVTNNTAFATTPGAEYSLRVYCNSSSGTGCTASGLIANY